MKNYMKIGILGGMSPESTTEFYNFLIKKYFEKNKDYSYPEIIIFSVNFEKIIQLQESGDKNTYIEELMQGILSLENAGAEFAVIASNTPHMIFSELQERSNIPLLSIVYNTAHKAKKLKLKKLLLLGTKFTMQSTFYKDDFLKLDIEIVVPSDSEQKEINRIIFDELVQGIVKRESKESFMQIINNYSVEGVILGCTELPLIVKPEDTTKILLNTLDIHVESTLSYAIRQG